MAAPTKPWERADQNNRACCQPGGDTGIPGFQAADRGMVGPGVNHARTPAPSIPSRDGFSQTGSLYGTGTPYNRFGSSYGGLSGYNSYGSYGHSSPYTSAYGGSSMYSPYGGYGGYGGYSGGMYGNRLGGSPEGYSRFLQQAEENSRPAFQSIESIVQAFGSVSMMLESTFATVHNCFRAVLGVADHFSRLKVNMARVLSALAVFRFLRYLYHRLLEMLRLRQSGYAEDLWKEAAEGALAVPGNIASPGGGTHSSPSWPIFMFFAVVVGGPYVIWRLLCSEDETQGTPEWASGEEDHVVARAEYDFASDRPDEVSFRAGDLLNLAPKELQPNIRGWLLASVDGSKVGLVPGNYVKVQGRRKGRKYTTSPGTERLIVPSPSTTGLQPPATESMGSQVSESDLASSWNKWAGDTCGGGVKGPESEGPQSGLDQAYREGEGAS